MVPNDAKVLEPVLKRAQEAGIKVITHESPGQINADWDFELLDTQSMGANHMKDMAQCMGEEGKYAMFVGSLTVPLVNEWADAAIAYQKANYPKMVLVEDRFGVAESVDDSMRTANDLLSKHKDLKGIMSFGSQGPIGAGRAIDKRKRTIPPVSSAPSHQARALSCWKKAPLMAVTSPTPWSQVKSSSRSLPP